MGGKTTKKGGPQGSPPGGGTPFATHAIYLAVIVVLLAITIFAAAQSLRAKHTLDDFETRFGLQDEVRSAIPRAEPLRTLTAKELLRPRTFDEYRAEVDGLVDRALELNEFGAGVLGDACSHALRGGKRLRSIIVLEVARMVTLAREGELADAGFRRPVDAADVALFIEYLHTASLVVDDLPEFDDDPVRRGKPSVHAKTSRAVAQMASLSLIAAAYQDACRQFDWIREHCPEFKNADRVGLRLCHDISAAIGAGGAASGQVMDSALSGPALAGEHGDNAVLKIMHLKTATFFELAVVAGWLAAGGDPAEADTAKRIGNLFGVAFQVADDIGDAAQDAARRAAGKPGWNYANEHGVAAATALVTKNLAACAALLKKKKLYSPLWEEIFEKTWGMTEAEV